MQTVPNCSSGRARGRLTYHASGSRSSRFLFTNVPRLMLTCVGLLLAVCIGAALMFTFHERSAKPLQVREPNAERALEPRIDRYVSPEGDDSGDGSKAHPWKTLQKAAEMVKPGVTVHVAPGLYVSDEDLKTTISGTPRAMIRYVSDVNGQALLRCTK